MTLYISQSKHTTKEHYHMGKSIILPHVRYIDNGKRDSIMYHSQVINSNGHFYTLGCNGMGVSGLCSGHKIGREEFIKRYCDGIEPDTETNKEQ